MVPQIFVSGPLGLRAGKESRILASSMAQRWPKTLLYHSGDRPLEERREEAEGGEWAGDILEIGSSISCCSIPSPGESRYLRSALQMWVTRERPMVLGSMRYWEVSTMALTPPSTGTLSCSTERELSRQAPRGRSVRQRL